MNDAIFLKNFVFNEYCFNEICHRDNTKGIDCHCIGFMKHGRTPSQIRKDNKNGM